MFGDHPGVNPAPDIEFAAETHEARASGPNQIVQDPIGDRLMKGAFVPIGPDVLLQGLKFHAAFIRDVFEGEFREVRLPRLGAETGEFRDLDANGVIALRGRVGKGVQFSTWDARHGLLLGGKNIPQSTRAFLRPTGSIIEEFLSGTGQVRAMVADYPLGNSQRLMLRVVEPHGMAVRLTA